MKELSIEEKAKRYDEALIKGSKLWESDMITRENYEYIFPEVKESEDEEIKEMLKVAVERTPWMQDKKEKCYEWLEKQGEQKTVDEIAKEVCKNKESATVFLKSAGIINEKGELAEQYRQGEQNPADEVGNYDHKKVLQTIVNEQKPVDKVEPKFKVGDWVTRDGWNYHIDEVLKSCYKLSDINDNHIILPHFVIDNYHWSWTIQDAKDGDVLFMYNGLANCIFIYKSSNNGIINKYASYNKFGFESEHYLVLNDGYVIPATKEQRDILMKAMADAGYTFDFEKKELLEQLKKLREE